MSSWIPEARLHTLRFVSYSKGESQRRPGTAALAGRTAQQWPLCEAGGLGRGGGSSISGLERKEKKRRVLSRLKSLTLLCSDYERQDPTGEVFSAVF